jgi:hypothetical protein
MKTGRRLRIEPVSGVPINDYRMRRGRVEFRALDRDGAPLGGDLSQWRPLTDYEVKWHYALGTVVAEWMSFASNN